MKVDWDAIATPCYLCDTEALQRNLDVLSSVARRTGCKVLLALKAFAMFGVFPLLREYLHGVSASSLHEAKLGAEEFGREVHLCAPAYRDDEMAELVSLADCIVFNSFSQWRRHRPAVAAAGRKIHCGLRINPEHSEAPAAIYDPCAPHSRLGIRREQFDGQDLEGITGLHFHSLCEQGAEPLVRTVASVEAHFADILGRMDWLNLGGGHHITRDGYDLDAMCGVIDRLQQRYGVDVYIEPGEAVALNAGVLVASVLDIVENGMPVAILDTSAAAHMPDVLEMPYRPEVIGAGEPGEKAHTCRLAGPTCLAGDVIGDYSFDAPLAVGDHVVFCDMAHYTMVKNNTFNGIQLPAIATCDGDGAVTVIRRFGYEDFKGRLS